MHLRFALILSFAPVVMAIAQGTVNFNNSPNTIGGNGAPIFDVDGTTRLEGEAFLAQLWAGPDINSLTPWGAPLTFRTGAGAGYFNTTGVNTSRIIGNVAPGAVATIQVHVWEATATGFPLKFGRSAAITVITGGGGSPPSLPANLAGLTSFSLIPEPAILALFAFGVVALLLRRRG